MNNILLVTSSPRGEASLSMQIARELVSNLLASNPQAVVRERNLWAAPLPAIGEAFAVGSKTPLDLQTPEHRDALRLSGELVNELFQADAIVIATGMINFSVPAALKLWIDQIARAGLTFRYSEAGPEGLLKGKKAYVVAASGGIYSTGPAEAMDHQVPYLRAVLSFLGLEVEEIRIEGIAYGPEAAEKALADASARVRELTSELSIA